MRKAVQRALRNRNPYDRTVARSYGPPVVVTPRCSGLITYKELNLHLYNQSLPPGGTKNWRKQKNGKKIN